MIRLTSLLLLLSIIILNSCKLDAANDCYFIAPAYPISVDGPATANVNQPVNFIMTFQLANGCGSFLDTQTFNDADTTEIIIRAKYQGCVCTQQIINNQQNFSYTPTRSGAHYFKYFVNEGIYLRDTVWVQ